jgi:hypothetical protein
VQKWKKFFEEDEEEERKRKISVHYPMNYEVANTSDLFGALV